MIRRGIGVQSFVSAGGVAPTDADAQAFITAAGITDATQQSAINTLVTDLKGYGIWTKMKAIYPFVGGTSSTHKWNLKDPRDLDAAFRLVFSGGWTHSSTGATPNGTNGFANTYFIANSNLDTNNGHISYYSRDNKSDSGTPIGTGTGGDQFVLTPKLQAGGSQDYTRIFSWPSPTTAQTNINGLFLGNRNSASQYKKFRNGISYETVVVNFDTKPSTALYIGARNGNGTAGQYSNLECAFASIGDGLTDTEAANLYTAVQAYQTTLNRNI